MHALHCVSSHCDHLIDVLVDFFVQFPIQTVFKAKYATLPLGPQPSQLGGMRSQQV